MYTIKKDATPTEARLQVQAFMQKHSLAKCYQVGARLFKQEVNARECEAAEKAEMIVHNALEVHNEKPIAEEAV